MPVPTSIAIEVHLTEPDGTTMSILEETTHGDTLGLDAIDAALQRQRERLADPDYRTELATALADRRSRWRRVLRRSFG